MRHEGQNICAGWLYKTDSTVCILEWIISNPKAPKALRGEALDQMIDVMNALASGLGFKVIYAMAKVPRLLKRYRDKGFVTGDQNMTHLTKVI
jgi:hypothetical protein